MIKSLNFDLIRWEIIQWALEAPWHNMPLNTYPGSVSPWEWFCSFIGHFMHDCCSSSLAGCPEAAVGNIHRAVHSALAHGGLGMVISHWSGVANVTHQPFAWAGLLTAAGLAWNANVDLVSGYQFLVKNPQCNSCILMFFCCFFFCSPTFIGIWQNSSMCTCLKILGIPWGRSLWSWGGLRLIFCDAQGANQVRQTLWEASTHLVWVAIITSSLQGLI